VDFVQFVVPEIFRLFHAKALVGLA